MIGVVLDGEELALRALARNASRIRVSVATVALTAAFAAGFLASWVVREMMFEVLGANIVAVTAAIAYGLPCGAAIVLARAISRFLIRARQEAWIIELAQQHGVPADRLRDAAALW
jgi:hypothetical protein